MSLADGADMALEDLVPYDSKRPSDGLRAVVRSIGMAYEKPAECIGS